jgi:hypothetical protein
MTADSKTNFNAAVELLFDYLFALREERKSPREQVELLLEFCNTDKTNQLFRYGPVYTQHWLIALRDFHVTDIDSMKLLDRALSGFVNEAPNDISSKAAEHLLNLGNEVASIETPTLETKKAKAQTIWHLFLLCQKDKVFGHKLGTLAIEQIADMPELQDAVARSATFRVLYSFSEQPSTKDDGDLLFRDVVAVSKIIHSTKNLADLTNASGIFGELALRCSTENALEAQKGLVESAQLVNGNEKLLATLNLQLASAYINCGQLHQAETILLKQKNGLKPIGGLCLAECFRRQRKFVEADKLATELTLSNPSFDTQYPSFYKAMAKAIHAQSLIDQRKYALAVPLLTAADRWFNSDVARDRMEIRNFSFVESTLPNENKVLANLALVYGKLGRKVDEQKAKKVLAEVEATNTRNSLLSEKTALEQLAALQNGEQERSFNQTKRVIDIITASEKNAEMKVKMILDYAEVLIKTGKVVSANMCLQAGANTKLVSSIDQNLQLRISIDRVLLAEARGDLNQASSLIKDLQRDNSLQSSESQLRIAEAEARLSLLNGDFEQAEHKSRPLESALGNMSTKAERDHELSQRDKFVREHSYAIMDRVISLNQVQKFNMSARLARLLLLLRSNDHLETDAAANLAYAYSQTKHKGLADAFTQEAEFKNFENYYHSTSRYLIDAKEKLAALREASNPVRARRYRAEAKEIREQLDKNNSSDSSNKSMSSNSKTVSLKGD